MRGDFFMTEAFCSPREEIAPRSINRRRRGEFLTAKQWRSDFLTDGDRESITEGRIVPARRE